MVSKHKNLTHLAIIMDGNGRWASKNMFQRIEGHKKGVETVEMCIRYCKKNNISFLSLYTFSTENWKRPESEVSFLMNLLEKTLQKKIATLLKENIEINILGDISKLPLSIQHFQKNKQILKNPCLTVNLMINYGARDELVHACKKIATSYHDRTEAITPELIQSFLYTKMIPDPEFLIRTGGEQRLSNFLLWQCAYTEFYFSNVLWPEFKETHLDAAVINFTKRKRRFGDIS